MQKPFSLMLSLFTILVALDQTTKWWVTQTAWKTGLIFTNNPGVSFGIFGQLPSWLLSLVLGGVIAVVYLVAKPLWQQYRWASCFFFAGAVSNVLDRIFKGSVQDWMPIPGTPLHNNLADWYITGALVWIIIQELRRQAQPNKK